MKLANLFTVTTLTVSILAGCGGGEGDTPHVNKSSSIESGAMASSPLEANSQSSISQTDSKYSKTTVTKSSQFAIPNISPKATRTTEQPHRTPVMSVRDPVVPVVTSQAVPVLNKTTTPVSSTTVMSSSVTKPVAQAVPTLMPMQQAVVSTPQMVNVDVPKPMVQSAPVLNTLVIPEQPTSMTVVSATVASPSAQVTPESMPMQQAALSNPQMVSVDAPKPMIQSAPVFNALVIPEQSASMTVVSATVVSPSAQVTPESMPMQQGVMSTPQMVSVDAPKPMVQSAPVFNELTTPEQPTSMTVVSATVASPSAQTTPELMSMQQAVMSTPQMVSVEAPKPMLQSAPVLNELATPEHPTSMTVVSATVAKPVVQATPNLMPAQQVVMSTPQMVSVEAPKPMLQSVPVLNELATPEHPTSMRVVSATVASPSAQATPELMSMQQAVISTPQMVSIDAPKPMLQSAPVFNALATPEQPTSMTVVSATVASPSAQRTPDLMPTQQAVMSTSQMVSIDAPKPMLQSAPVKNEWVVATDTSLMSETLDFDSPALIIQEVPKEQPSVSQPSGDIVSDFAIAQVTSEFETAVDNINYLKDIVQSIVDHTGYHGNGHNNGVQTSHITLESGESLTIKVKHDGRTVEVTLDQSGHGHSQSVVLTGSLDYEPYTGAYTLIADFQDVSSLGISSVPSISSTIAGTYYNDNFYDIEVINYNNQFEYGFVYIDEEGNPYMAYATHSGLDINVEYRA